MLRVFVLSVALLAGSAQADDWTTADTQREAVYMVMHAMDWAQTRTIARNPDKWGEANPILGRHPPIDRVDAYFAMAALTHVAVSAALPIEYRSAWQYVSITIEAMYVMHNVSAGVNIKF